MKMIVLTIIADSNDHTVRFREPLGKSNYIRLLSCPLYNSWYNLKRRGEISISDRQNNASIETIPPGKYTLEGLAKAFGKILLLGIDQRLQGKNLLSRLVGLGCFDTAKSQFERVNYSLPNPVLRKITSRNDITSIGIFVPDDA